MLVLGLNYGRHDPSAALVDDGRVVSIVAEERLSRKKHAPSESPAAAVRWCLSDANVTPQEIDAIAVGWDFERERLLTGVAMPDVTWALPEEFLSMPALPPVHSIVHHVAHAASSFYCSGFDEAAVLIVDGRGEQESISLGVADHRGIRLLESLPIEMSLGQFYRAATEHAGLMTEVGFGAEGKLMGLAPYGVADQPMPLGVTDDGLVSLLDLKPETWEQRHSRATLREWWARNCYPYVDAETREIMAYSRFAASVQQCLVDAVLHLAGRARTLTGSANLVMAGGVALNCSANGVLVSSGLFENYYFQPASADDGVSLGAALEVCARDRIAHDRPARNDRMDHAYWGPSYDEGAVAAALRAAGLPSRRLAPEALVEEAAGLLDRGRIVGWFQGRAELGPRALGARSILADPRDRSVVPRLNHIKGREVWRPLAPSVKAEHFDEYFDSPFASPFMNVAAQVRRSVRPRVPATVHIDGSARPQAVRQADSPVYWSLIDAFQRRSGLPIVLNTSFNLATEPIVTTPEQAIASYLACDMDALVLGGHLVEMQPADPDRD